ncbi:hypothetical protein ACULLB_18115 (plasmid) [Enterococcus gallinarum]|uniref:hypothetical protein n=1 Tax=Enterococcus gallinarum TaxID=1353 RepID=UPI001C3D92F7|nr:hypothetical protein [Enterococcus gallinarum]
MRKRFYGLMGIIYPIIGSINAGRNEIDVKRRKNHVHMNVLEKKKGSQIDENMEK